ncbi:hypothetical protein [Devosia sp.]|uniref:hypothetical protein n=1 Tax=Devosia sp. TaxID=1871048 RepID=UPI001AC685F9|nr:hypothetical protein [Devosia sp.]MBN9332319.1 hypothetical protein [Devosia sp.]
MSDHVLMDIHGVGRDQDRFHFEFLRTWRNKRVNMRCFGPRSQCHMGANSLAVAVCDEIATALGIHAAACAHKDFGDVSRHNLILNEIARHSGAGAGRLRMTLKRVVLIMPAARQTA